VQQQTGQFSPDGYWMWNGAQWVPNPYRPLAAPPPADPFQPAEFRAFVTTVLLVANLISVVLFTFAIVIGDLSPSAADNLLIAFFVLFAVAAWLATLVAAVVFFCMWLHRVVRNMPALGAPDPRWSPARSVVFCFIPIVNWFHPLWSTLDAWRGADPSRRWIDQATRKTIRPPAAFTTWWATWLIGNYAFNISARLNGNAAALFDVLAGACLVAAGLFCITIVRDVTARQERKNQLIAGGQLV
jgi:hypothetical protein